MLFIGSEMVNNSGQGPCLVRDNRLPLDLDAEVCSVLSLLGYVQFSVYCTTLPGRTDSVNE